MKVLIITYHDYGWGAAAAAFLRDYSSKIEAVSASCLPPNTKDSIVIDAMRECLIHLEDEHTFYYHEHTLYDSVDADAHAPRLNPESFDVTIDLHDDYPRPANLDEARIIRDQIKNDFFIWLRSKGKIQ